jgi:hypothetical protein
VVYPEEGLYFIELVIIIEYEHLFTNEVQKIEMYLRTLLRSSRPIFKIENVIGKFETNLGPACWKVTWNRQ